MRLISHDRDVTCCRQPPARSSSSLSRLPHEDCRTARIHQPLGLCESFTSVMQSARVCHDEVERQGGGSRRSPSMIRQRRRQLTAHTRIPCPALPAKHCTRAAGRLTALLPARCSIQFTCSMPRHLQSAWAATCHEACSGTWHMHMLHITRAPHVSEDRPCTMP